MRKAPLMIAAAALLITSCVPIREELYYPNGYTGYELDRHSVNVSASKQFQLVRAAIVLAMASRMATATVHDGRDADAVADYLAAASDELNYSAADLFPATSPAGIACSSPTDLKSNKCTGYVQNFESDLPMLEGRIINVMIAALPQERSRQFLSDIRKGDILGASLAALRTVFQSVVGLDRSAGVYRSGLELFASSANCEKVFDAKKGTVADAARCLGIPPAGRSYLPEPLTFKPPADDDAQYALTALMRIGQTSCVHMPLSSDEAVSDAANRRDAACGKVKFEPKQRPVTLVLKDQTKSNTATQGAPAQDHPKKPAGKGAKKTKAGH